MKRTALGLILGLFLVCGSAAFASGDYEDRGWVVGSGNIDREDRTVPRFDAIEVEGSGNVVFRQSDSQLVRVETDDNILPLVKTEVVDGVLHLGLVHGAHATHLSRLEFSLASPRIQGIVISGSGNARTTGPVHTSEMRLEIRGSGSIDCDARAASVEAVIGGSGGISARGSADRLSVTINGSGSVRAHELKTGEANVTINGSGDVAVFATDTLEASVNGSGSIRYGGGARATVHRSGSGSVVAF